MSINFKPRVGQLLVCHFGDYPSPPVVGGVHGRLPPEMVKQRLVVVLNAKHPQACVVVPLSATQHVPSVTRGFHVPIPAGTLPPLNYWDDCDRWVKCDTIQMVSNDRLDRVLSKRGHAAVHLTHEEVTRVQKAVIRVIGGAGTFLAAPANDAAPPTLEPAPQETTKSDSSAEVSA